MDARSDITGRHPTAAIWPLRVLLLAAILGPLIIFAVIAVITYQQTMEQGRERLDGVADIMREHALKVFDTTTLLFLEMEDAIDGLSDEEIRAREIALRDKFRRLRRPLVQTSGMSIIDRNGRLLVASELSPVPENFDLSDREYFVAIRDNPGRGDHISRPLRSRVAGNSDFFQLSHRRTARDGSFAGVITVAVQPAYFAEVYRQLDREGNLLAALIRSDGTLLALHPFVTADITEIPPVKAFADIAGSGTAAGRYLTRSGFDGKARMVAYRKLGDLPVYVAAGMSLGDMRAGWVRWMAGGLAFALLFMAILYLLATVAIRRTRRESVALQRLEAESERRAGLEVQLRQAAKMEAIGQLSGGIAHDFNNLLTVIGGNLELLLRRLPPGEAKLQRQAEAALKASERAAQLTQRLLAFSRRLPLKPEPADLNRLIAGMADLLHRSLGETIVVETSLAEDAWSVFADVGQVENAILNLAINARDAMPEGGKLTIATSNVHLDAGAIARAGLEELQPGDYVLLCVGDSGTGMPDHVAAKAFDPFFTTKPVGQGTGLGLSTVYGFVRQSGGEAVIDSTVGKGTTVRLYLPRASEAAPAEREGGEQKPVASGRGESVLVVEDDAAVRGYAVEVLRQAGYQVTEAANGKAAEDALAGGGHIDILLTDMVLPGGMNGRDIAEAAQRSRPGVKVLFMTGYTNEGIIHGGRLDRDVELITKPFSAGQLLDRLAKVLRGT